MNFDVLFHESGKVETYDIDFNPHAGQEITLVRDGKAELYYVETVSGPIIDGTSTPTSMRVRKM